MANELLLLHIAAFLAFSVLMGIIMYYRAKAHDLKQSVELASDARIFLYEEYVQLRDKLKCTKIGLDEARLQIQERNAELKQLSEENGRLAGELANAVERENEVLKDATVMYESIATIQEITTTVLDTFGRDLGDEDSPDDEPPSSLRLYEPSQN